MRHLILLIALAWVPYQAAAAACNTTTRLNGFDAPGACTGTSEVAGPVMTSMHAVNAVAAGGVGGFTFHPEGDFFGLINTLNVGIPGTALTVTAANFASGVGADFTAYQFLSFAQATSRAASSFFVPELAFTNVATSYVFNGQQAVQKAAGVAALGDWTNVILSLNYARNLGLPVNSIASVSVRWRSTSGSQPFTMGYDDMAVSGPAVNVPNTPLDATDLAVTTACAPHNVTLTPQAQTGADPIAGYHVYRSTNGPGGPYVSHRYVNSAPWAFTETAPFSNNVYYKVLPYSGTTAAFNGGAPGHYGRASNTTMDPVNSQIAAGGGVHEALLSAATAIGPFDQVAACPPTPTPTYTQTLTFSPTFTVTPTHTPTFTSTSTFSSTPTFTATPTHTVTLTPEPPTVTFTPAPPTLTFTPVPPTLTFTPVPPTLTFTPGPSNTVTPSFTVTSTFTITPTPTDVPPGPTAQLYPNPFNPDKELFYLGNVRAGSEMNIYNLIGERVYRVGLKGNPNFDFWDGLNSNGVKVVTGIYFVVIDGAVYRLAVVRN